ncbi:hypothetical protein QYM36_000799, partial [Artemia franciscana]
MGSIGSSVLHNGRPVLQSYGIDLDNLEEGDRVGVMRTREGDLVFYVNSCSQGVAASNIPGNLYVVLDLYGSIEVGVTTHDPSTLSLPATMTNLRSGTIMISGYGILTNGRCIRHEYGQMNLDELKEGDIIGIIRKSNAELHYYINDVDQGVASKKVPARVWGVVDLYEAELEESLLFHTTCGLHAAVVNGGKTAHRP